MIPLFIDSDNALGAPSGDIDDAFAVAVLVKSGIPISAISSVFGNASEDWVYRNHLECAKICGYGGPILHGATRRGEEETESSRRLADETGPTRVLAMGPMTNVAAALRKNPDLPKRVDELVFLGGNLGFPAPAFRFVDFNQWQDPLALRTALGSELKMTCLPLNLARRLRMSWKDLSTISGDLGNYFREHSRRWFRRARLGKFRGHVPVWDLVSALYVLRPGLFTTRDSSVVLGRFGQFYFGPAAGRPLKVVIDFDPAVLWTTFLEIVSNKEQIYDQRNSSGECSHTSESSGVLR